MERPCPVCHENRNKLKYTADELSVVKCSGCGFVYTLNPVRQNESSENYDNYFHASDVVEQDPASADHDENAFAIYRERLNAVQNISKNSTLLEIGCGRGYFLDMASKAGFQVKGIEISKVAAHYAGLHFGLNVRVGDFESMSEPEESFDVIVMWHVLEHFYDPVSVLESVYGLLNENGVLFIEVPNLNSIKFQISPHHKKWQGGNHPQYHLSFFDMTMLTQVLKKVGFTRVENLHLQYPEQNNMGKTIVKKIANICNLDSFLSVKVYKN